MEFSTTIESYILTGILDGSIEKSQAHYDIKLSHCVLYDGSYKRTDRCVYIKIRVKYAPYLWKELAKYKNFFKVIDKTREYSLFYIKMNRENDFILTKLDSIFNKIVESYERCNEDVEQNFRV